MRRVFISIAIAICIAFSATAFAGDKTADQAGANKAPKEMPKAEQSVTQHSVEIGGHTFKYTATAGTLILRDADDKPIASMSYVAYTKRGVDDKSRRPVTFAYNGGPGSSSMWLHMGALGPKRVAVNDATPTPPPPYKLVDNAYSVIDKTDLVMIDPVGTGLSKPLGDKKGKDFWGVDQDIKSVSQFIKQYVSDNSRWNSPKYLLGESYGTMRSAGVVDYLQTRDGMDFNGVILISVFINARTAITYPGNDQAYEFYLPTYAAVAWYHDALADKPKDLKGFLDQARAFAAGEYADALAKGDKISDAEFDAVAQKMHQFTGLPANYIKKAKLRVEEGQFTKELLRDKGETVGRLDSRFTGTSFDLLGEFAKYDPQSAQISPAYVAAFMHYYHNELKFGKGKTYKATNYKIGQDWDFKHAPPGGGGYKMPGWPNTSLDLAHAMGYNPNLQVLVLNGYFDLATPFFATEYTMDHMGLDKKLQPHIHMKYFESGHMMYVHPDSLKKFKSDIGGFIDSTDRL